MAMARSIANRRSRGGGMSSKLYTLGSLSIILASALYAPVNAVAAGPHTAPKGVAPQDAHLYLPNSDDPLTWTCLDGSTRLPLSAINDDYCDCPDSSDEPGTSACPAARFYCHNEGHIPAYILSSRVNDGICDPECCDGSDEDDGKIKCPDVCAKVGREHRKRKQEAENLRRAGSKIRAGYIREAQKKLETLHAEVASLEVEIEVARELERVKKAEFERAEKVDQAVIEEKKKSPLYATLRAHQDGLKALVDREDLLKQELQKLTSLLDDLSSGYNPNYQDMAVKGAVMAYRSWRGADEGDEPTDGSASDSAESPESEAGVDAGNSKDSSAAPSGENLRLRELLDEGDWPRQKLEEMANKETLELMDDDVFKGAAAEKAAASVGGDGNILFRLYEYLPEPLIPVIDGAVDNLLDLLVKAHVLSAFQRTPRRSSHGTSDSNDETAAEPESVTAARKAFVDAEAHARTISSQLSTKRSQLDMVPEKWGLEGEWKPLDGKCIERNMGEYTYEYCFFGGTMQKPNKPGGSNVSLGRFARFDGNSTHTDDGFFSRQLYDRGQRCWNGPERSVVVSLSCGSENELLDVFEAEKCIYSMKVTTPALCYPLEAEQSQSPPRPARDEL
ncbi:unnamed protein product [Parajaminaea phylloscopi]